jgi:hypothetical protein
LRRSWNGSIMPIRDNADLEHRAGPSCLSP